MATGKGRGDDSNIRARKTYSCRKNQRADRPSSDTTLESNENEDHCRAESFGIDHKPTNSVKRTDMERKGRNRVFIAASLDGYIADADGKVGFLDTFPMPDNDDMGFAEFMGRTDAILMGRKSFETVLGFEVAWPYSKHVFVWSHTLDRIPGTLDGRVTLIRGDAMQVLEQIHKEGLHELYIDGGMTIQSFLRYDLIDEITITTIPVLLGGGIPLFGSMDGLLTFKCVKSGVYGNGLVQNVFERTNLDRA